MRHGWVVSDFIRAGLDSRPEGTYVGFLTLTEGSRPRSVELHSEAAGRFLGGLWRLLAKAEGVKAADAQVRPYFGVREFQRRGAVHSHYLVVGWPRLDLSDLRDLATKYGFGRTNVKALRLGAPGQGQDVQNVGAYMAKTFGGYMSKSFADRDVRAEVMELLPPRYRLVVHSRDWVPGETLESFTTARRVARPDRVVNPVSVEAGHREVLGGVSSSLATTRANAAAASALEWAGEVLASGGVVERVPAPVTFSEYVRLQHRRARLEGWQQALPGLEPPRPNDHASPPSSSLPSLLGRQDSSASTRSASSSPLPSWRLPSRPVTPCSATLPWIVCLDAAGDVREVLRINPAPPVSLSSNG